MSTPHERSSTDGTSASIDASGADEPPNPRGVPDIDLRPARQRLRVERRILSDERSAFRCFCDRLLAIDGGAPSDELLAHYRGTVMSVPHYWSEYGDTATESLAAEFGATLAHDLDVRDRVEAPTIAAIRRAGERSLRVRDDLVDRIDAERHAVASAAEELEAIRRELLDLDVAAAPDSAHATRLTLAALRDRCDEVARRRREQLQPDAEAEGDESFGLLSEGAGAAEGGAENGKLPPGRLQSLCYRELAVDWPVLAGVEALREAIEDRRRAALDVDPDR